MNNDGSEAIAWIAILVIGLAIFAIAGIVWAIVWWVAAAAAKEAKRRFVEKRAGEDFDHAMTQKGYTLPGEDLVDMLFDGGMEFSSDGGLDAFDVLVYATGGQEDEHDPSI